MQYIIGSLTTALLLWVCYSSTRHVVPVKKTVRIVRTQSHTYDLLKPVFPILNILAKKKMKTQASKHLSSVNIRVLILEEKAYWIKDNALYIANVDGNKVDKESAKVVDTMTMNKVELDKITFIVDKLTEGMEDDRSNSGNS